MPDNENKLATIEPETREETFLQDIADGTQTLTPVARKEEFLRRISAKPGVPSITESDEGKVLTVESGEAVWGEASSLPEITGQDEGKVLTVESGEAVWGEGGGSCLVPEPTSDDVGKVLTAEAETEITVIVPEQTVTVSDPTSPVPLSGVTEQPEVGETLTATINGETYTAELEGTAEMSFAAFDGVAIGWLDGVCVTSAEYPGTYTLDVRIETVTGDIVCVWSNVEALESVVTLDIVSAYSPNNADYAVSIDGVTLGKNECEDLFESLKGKTVLFDDGDTKKYGYFYSEGASFMVAFDYVVGPKLITVGYIGGGE